jgi:hypothetical protein
MHLVFLSALFFRQASFCMMLSPKVRGQASKKNEQMALAAEQDGHGETVNVSSDTLLLLSFSILKLLW